MWNALSAQAEFAAGRRDSAGRDKNVVSVFRTDANVWIGHLPVCAVRAPFRAAGLARARGAAVNRRFCLDLFV